MNVGIAHPAFIESFRNFFPDVSVVSDIYRIKQLDLIIFSGGSDINPRIYGQKNTNSLTDDSRDVRELWILEKAIEQNVKILGVCRGHQLINAYLGGILAQDLYHVLNIFHGSFHSLFFLGNSIIRDSFPNGVNSLHHQGVLLQGDGLKITSVFKKVIESTENDNIISVQCHPESMKDGEIFFNKIKEWV